jgi:CheY-like chemotaxis protein
MPELDGLETTRYICKQWSPASRPWIIAMTAHSMPGDREDCLKAGMNDYISKPIRAETMAQAFRNYQKLQPSTEQITQLITSQSVIDSTVIQGLKDMGGEDGDEILAEIIDSYLEDAPKRLQAIKAAIAGSNPKALNQSAHALRSISAAVGAIRVAQICGEIETIGGIGSTVMANGYISELEGEYKQVQTALQFIHTQRE